MEKIIQFRPAFDKRSSIPGKNYGVGSMTITFILKGSEGATQFVFNTGCYLPHNMDELWGNREDSRFNPFKGEGWNIGYHSPKPMYENQSPMRDECEVIGGKCYYDGTSLGASEFTETFLKEGDEAVWKMLQEEYNDRFLDPEKQYSSEESKEME